MCLTADPGVVSLILAQSHTFTEIDHEIISSAILLPSFDSRRVVVSYKCTRESMCTKYWSSLPKQKVRLGEVTLPVDWDVKNQTKQTKCLSE